jgi:polycomb protein EED
MWWVRFSVSLAGDLLACGNGAGKVFVWDPSGGGGGAAELTLSHKGCVRVVGVSYFGGEWMGWMVVGV